MSAILFTGFPGFIGMRLLPQILERQPDARIACLVQDKFLDVARRSLEALEAAHPHTRARLDARERRHHAAGPRHRERAGGRAAPLAASGVAPRRCLRPRGRARGRPAINVDGTRHVLEFAAGAPPASSGSSTSRPPTSRAPRAVSSARPTSTSGRASRTTTRTPSSRPRSRWCARGCPPRSTGRGSWSATRRPARRGSSTGPTSVLRLMERLPSPGVFPRVGLGTGTVNIVPVDFVVGAMVALVGRCREPRPHLPPVRSAAALAGGAHGDVRRGLRPALPVPAGSARSWRAPASRRPRVQRYFGLSKQALDYFHDAVRHDTTQASRDLGALGVECPRLADYLPQLIAFYRAHRDGVRQHAMS